MTARPMSLREEIKQTKPFPSVATEVYLNLLRTTEYLQASFHALLKEHDISHPQYNALRILRGAGDDGLPCLDIAERMVTRAPDITRLVDRLEESGYVRRVRSDRDRRVVRVKITRQGMLLLADMDKPVRKKHKAMFGHLEKAELVELVRLLEKIRNPHAND